MFAPRVAADLDQLRATYLPSLSPTLETPGGDYRYRAWIGRDELAYGMAKIARTLDYSNFIVDSIEGSKRRARKIIDYKTIVRRQEEDAVRRARCVDVAAHH